MKKYTIEVVIEEGNDEFWVEINRDNKTGCDDVLEIIRRDLFYWSEKIKLVEYTDK